jgi:hypothetical protein
MPSREGSVVMERYNFEVLADGEKAVIAQRVPLPDASALWLQVGRIARLVNKPGRMIRVTNAAGRIVILVGVATALRMCAEIYISMPPT